MKSTLRLFSAVPITKRGKKKATPKILKETIKRGFVFSPEVIYNVKNLGTLIKLVEKELGLTKEKMNATIHKSWAKVRDAPIEQLVFEQIMHYITTYGFEALGIYNESTVFIPHEKLEIPDIENDFHFRVIRGYTKAQLKKKLLVLLKTGIALKEETIADVVDVAMFVGLTKTDIETIKNREVKIALYDGLQTIPENPTEFLRYVIFKTTDSTLLIKSRKAIESIKEKDNKNIIVLFKRYKDEYGFERLAEIFYRFKPLFLAFRTNDTMKRYVNKIRRLAVKNHSPMNEDYLNSVTRRIARGKLNEDTLKKALKKVSAFRKIRLAYALKYRTLNADSILYKIRNGKGYATEFSFSERTAAKRALDIVLKSLAKDVKKNVDGKKIYIPDNISYSLPSSEKQYTGFFPSGTYIVVPKDMLVGVSWANEKGHRIDLDLSLIGTEKYGWDARYRDGSDILFSGDMTTAGTEVFYVKKQAERAFAVLLNYWNYNKEISVPYKIIVASEKRERLNRHRVVDPNSVLAVAAANINRKQKILGLLITTMTESRFYFAETSVGRNITSSNKEYIKQSKRYMTDFYMNMISLKDVLEMAGAKFTTNKKKCDIDLSPETLEKDTIINLLK